MLFCSLRFTLLMLFNAWHCSVWLLAAFVLHASCSILHCPRRCDACNGICVCLFLVCSVVLACFTLLMLSSLLALAPGDLLLVSPSSRCSHRRLCVYIVQPSRLAACRLACHNAARGMRLLVLRTQSKSKKAEFSKCLGSSFEREG